MSAHYSPDCPLDVRARHEAYMAAIEQAAQDTWREFGVPESALRCVWYHASRDSSQVVVIGRFLSRARPRQPAGYASAFRHGLVGVGSARPDFFSMWWTAPLTARGRNLLWRLHERLALVHR